MHYSFDFDYTLADSSKGIIISFNYALEKLGLPKRTDIEIKKTIGLSLKKALHLFVPEIDKDDLDTFTSMFKEKSDEVMLENINFYNDVETTLTNLFKSGHYISIVSTKYRQRIEHALKRDKIFHLINNIIGGECVTKVKPNPEGLNKAIEISGISTENTVYIGDSVSDGECASRAKVRFIAVTTGVTELYNLKKWNPIVIISNLNELNIKNA